MLKVEVKNCINDNYFEGRCIITYFLQRGLRKPHLNPLLQRSLRTKERTLYGNTFIFAETSE